MKKIFIATLTGTALLASSAALADGATISNPTQGTGLYLSFTGGLAWTPDIDFSKDSVKLDTKYDLGGNGLFAFGYQYNNWRTDISLGYLYNEVDDVKDNGTSLSADGHVDVFTYLVNGYYDINTNSNFIPYVGAGIGGAYIDFDDSDIDHTTAKLEGDENALAYQGIVGLAYQCTPNLRAMIDYHYLSTTDITVKATDQNGETRNVDENYQSNLFNVGLSWTFNT